MIKTQKASNFLTFVIVGGFAFGIALGVVKSAHLSVLASLLSLAFVLLVMWLIFRQGKAASYSSAQAWANSQADAAAAAYSMAQAKAEALSQAYSLAIASANAQASNVLQQFYRLCI